MGVWWRWWEGVHGVVVARGFAVRITAALNYKGVGSSCSSNNNNVGCLRVHTSDYERNLLKDQHERIRGCNESTLLRVLVKGINKRDGWKVGVTSFWCHCDRRKEKQNDKQR
jgi:hypothetical protein